MKNLYKQFLIIFAFIISWFGLKAQISGPTSLCQNTSGNYATPTAATYNWSVSPSGSETISNPSIQNPNISFSVAGNYTITVTTTSPINTFTMSVVVNANPIVTVSSNSPVCAGNPINLVSSNGGIVYSWSGPNTFSSSTQNPSIASASAAMSGSYTVTVTNINNCTSMATTSVIVNPQPVMTSASSGSVCNGNSLNIPLTSNMSSFYSWVAGNNPNTTGESLTNQTTNNINNTLTNSTTTTQTISYSVTPTAIMSGCVGNTQIVSVSVNPTPVISAMSNINVCSETYVSVPSFTVTPVGGSTISWVNSNTSVGLPSSGTGNIIGYVAPTVSTSQIGTITATPASMFGCVGSSIAFNMTIQPNPTISVNATATNPSSCGGMDGSLTGFVASGSGPFQFSLNGGPFSSTSPNYTGISAGTYTITALSSNGCSVSSTYNLSDPAPPAAPTTTDVQYCQNAAATQLQATGSGGTLTWIAPGGGTTTSSPIPSTAIVGIETYYVYETLNGCVGASSPLNVTVMTLPNIFSSNNGPYCENENINLISSGGNSYTWAGPNGFSSNQQNPSIFNSTVAMSGNYTITVVGSNGCTNTSNTNVIVNTLPTVNISSNSPVCEGGAISLFSSGGTFYSWLGPNGFSSNQQNPSISSATISMAGNYTVTVTDGNNCVNANVTTVATYPSFGITGTIYANSTPITAGQVYLFSPSQTSFAHDTIDITSVNSNGQYSFASVPAGDYFIKCVPTIATNPSPFNTYYGDVANWQFADTVHHDCGLNSVADINLITHTAMGGSGNISGTIVQGNGFGNRLINSNNQIQNTGDPVVNADVNLVAIPSNTIVAQSTTDVNGNYAFNNVDAGNYELQVDIPGLIMDSTYTFNVVSQSISNLDFVADDNSIYPTTTIGIKQNVSNANLISIYPNPAKNTINIKFLASGNFEGKVEIVDNLGKTVASQNTTSELTQVNIESLNTGIYFVKVYSDKGINAFRVIKQ